MNETLQIVFVGNRGSRLQCVDDGVGQTLRARDSGVRPEFEFRFPVDASSQDCQLAELTGKHGTKTQPFSHFRRQLSKRWYLHPGIEWTGQIFDWPAQARRARALENIVPQHFLISVEILLTN